MYGDKKKKKKRYQKGGAVKGPSHEKGGVKAKIRGGGAVELEGGEYVVNKESAKKFKKQLVAINKDKASVKKLKPLKGTRKARKGGEMKRRSKGLPKIPCMMVD